MTTHYDILVVGGGMAGASIGYELSANHHVGVLDMEASPDVHSTGRSAAVFVDSLGTRIARGLSAASKTFLLDPPVDFEPPLMTPLGLLIVSNEPHGQALRDRFHRDPQKYPGCSLLDGDDARAINPILAEGYVDVALFEPGCMEMDVHAIHQGFLRGLRRRGGSLHLSSPVVSARHDGTLWHVSSPTGNQFTAPIIVNAAGAWADRVGATVGAAALGLQPLRRSVFMVAAPTTADTVGLPLTSHLTGEFYFKPEGPQFLCSPADETPAEPGHVQPDELEMARAIEAINDATTLGIRSIRGRWAGLRSFVADHNPVAGFDPRCPGLFWFAGQGGTGIQTAPAFARIGAALIDGQPIPDDVAALGVTADLLAPDRSALTGSADEGVER